MSEALTGAGADCEILAARDGTLQAANGGRIEVTRALPTVASVLYDAVVLPGGERAAQSLSGDGDAIHFVAEALKHGKAVGALGASADLLQTARLRAVRPDGDTVSADHGVVIGAAQADHAEFNRLLIEAIARHRHWDRATETVPASPQPLAAIRPVVRGCDVRTSIRLNLGRPTAPAASGSSVVVAGPADATAIVTGQSPPAGRRAVRRWNPVRDWVISERVLHPALVSEEDFLAAQTIRAARPAQGGDYHRYLLAGLMVCGICTRRMDAHWVNGRAGYRCRHGYTSAKLRPLDQPKNLYIREDRVLAALPGLIADLDHSLQAAGSCEIALYLRANDLKIVCDRRAWTITNEKESPRRPDPVGAFIG